jgi:hypothetical protein
VQQQLQQLETDIQQLQTTHANLQAFSLAAHQNELAAIEINVYAKLVQAGILKAAPMAIMPKIFNQAESPTAKSGNTH